MSSAYSLLLGAIGVAVARRSCYFPLGLLHDSGIPCDPDAEGAVACCQQNHTCLSNGLCWDAENNNILRESCTDSSFPIPGCLRKCDGDAQGRKVAYLRQCEGQVQNWTCTPDNKIGHGCANPFTLPPGRIEDYRESNVSNVVFASGEITRAAQTGGPTANSNENDVRQAKLQVGLGVGLGLGLPLLISLAISVWFLKRARREVRELENQRPLELTSLYGNEHPGKGNAASAEGHPAGGFTQASSPPPESAGHRYHHPHELDARVVMVEADTSVDRAGSVSRTPAQYYARPAPG